jgi:thymidylate synthase (FAD)
MKATLIAFTSPLIAHKSEDRWLTAEELIVYCARVSNPSNQENVETGEKLLRYCISHSHWSVFETASLTVEVQTSRAIAAQLLRHRSFTFQEFSQRFATVISDAEEVELRAKAVGGNRQGSGALIGATEGNWGEASPVHNGRRMLDHIVDAAVETAQAAYKSLLEAGVAPECARMVLPLCTRTTLYVTGNVRSWIHYFQQRCSPHAQKEHRLLAEAIRDTCFKAVFPTVHRIIGDAAHE